MKPFLRFLPDERGVGVSIKLRKLVAKSTDLPKLYLSAADMEKLSTAMLPANLVPVRDVFLFCCYTHGPAPLGRSGAAPRQLARVGRG